LNQAAIDEFADTLNGLKRAAVTPGVIVEFDPKKPRPETCRMVLQAIIEQYREGDF
jgi:hypothetical protein